MLVPENAKLPPVGARCQEASIQSSAQYIPCGRAAQYVIKNNDPLAYYMCDACADHSVRNRGARFVLVHERLAVFTPTEPVSAPVGHNNPPKTPEELRDWGITSSQRLAERLNEWFVPLLDKSKSAAELAYIFSMARQFNDELQEAVKILTSGIQQLSNDIIPFAFERDNATTINLTNGYRVTVQTKLYAGIKPETKAEAYQWLRDNNLGDIITETVNSGTLSATGKEMLSHGKELPESLFNSYFQKTTLHAKQTGKGK